MNNMTRNPTTIPTRFEYELERDIKFFLELFKNFEQFNNTWRREILISFRKSDVGLHRWQKQYPELVYKIQMEEHRLLRKQAPKWKHEYDTFKEPTE